MRPLILASLLFASAPVLAAPALSYRPDEDACRPKKVDKTGQVAESGPCTHFDPERHLGAHWKKAEPRLNGRRILYGSSSLNTLDGVGDTSSLSVSLAGEGKKRTALVDWTPTGGVSSLDDLYFSEDHHLLAVIFSPKGVTDPKKRVAAVFDVSESLAASK
jgi:hypothetical protein